MKCALPGMYGRKAVMESSFIQDSYLDAMRVDMDPVYNTNQEEVVKNYEEYISKIMNSKEDSIYDEVDKNNAQKELEALKRDLIQKDKEENE
jgi:hypothetical protein